MSQPVIKEHVVARRNDPATLNCAASGATRIRWYRDGEEVTTSTQDPRSHRVVLPSGSLFFLRVATSKRDSDAGTYWCVASNSHGATRSHNATLTVATLAYDFQSQADPVALRPPRSPGSGTPTRSPTQSDLRVSGGRSRHQSGRRGGLGLLRVSRPQRRGRPGVHAHQAHHHDPNGALSPQRPPWFEERPANVTVASGVVVELACRARGSPTPTVTWRRLDGKMPLGRAMIEDQRLVLDHVAAADSGVYVCEVESEAGIAAARATLTVIDAPEFAQRPQDVQVVAGQSARLSCKVEGDPKPLLLWRLPTQDRTALLAAGQSSGHASVADQGQTLLLGDDLTVSPGSVATFPCEAVVRLPSAISWWYRPAVHLPARQLSEGGNSGRPGRRRRHLQLHINADTGSVEQAAVLRVEDGAQDAGRSCCRRRRPSRASWLSTRPLCT
ncbi:Roundabout-like protein 2 [Penaeus vannamei]|uniref:Roundabout-like protein 2 n=1 Tax=Penaeus vannamei TaxID=6689 RepID=A0A3R7MP07_PENVA|nr:Roundabout-like protein 2 [Penaeus vannamei]